MRMVLKLFTLLTALGVLGVHAQILTYTNTQASSDSIPLGYEVPIPVDSLTPVFGFRTYDSLNLRHLQMAESSSFINPVQIGSTIEGRPIMAYRLSDSDVLTIDGFEEGAALINGGIHAREWQSPEAVTGFIEYLYNNQGDEHIGQFILENMNVVIIPVLNIDGFIQTQRFPTQVTNIVNSPRDGRMRRKNMRDTDSSLTTESDNLNGIDLNRNNNPYWATSNRSSSDSTNIVYHGTGPASEPETRALQQGAIEAGEDRLRFYIDVHSFTQVYFAPFTSSSRRNRFTRDMATIMRAANNYKYEFGPSGSGSGIGSTDEYFANTYQAASYTLEIEPANSNAEYGGTGVSHGGFILPNSEVPRMQRETSAATMAGLYAAAFPPSVTGLEIRRQADGQQVFSAQFEPQSGQRTLTVNESTPLQAAEEYEVIVVFNKPMRQIQDNVVVDFSNLSDALDIDLALVGKEGDQDVEYSINDDAGEWLVDTGFKQYKTDSFRARLTLPDSFNWDTHTLLALSVDTLDFAGQSLDADPSTPVDWQSGHFTQYEDEQGDTDTDTGGLNVALRLIDDGSDLFVSDAVEPPPPHSPTPSPTPQPESSSGGGTISFGALFLLVLLVLRLIGVVSRSSNNTGNF